MQGSECGFRGGGVNPDRQDMSRQTPTSWIADTGAWLGS